MPYDDIDLGQTILTSHWWKSLAFTWEQFHSPSTQGTILYYEFENHTFKIIAKSAVAPFNNMV